MKRTNSPGDNEVTRAFLSTIRGTKAAGFKTANYYCPAGSCTVLDSATWTVPADTVRCYGGTCESVTALPLDAGVVMPPQAPDFLSADDWTTSLTPPAWTSVQLTDRQ